ncbi:MAG: MarR family winged helix-turn-helix transcriptional regulator [Xenophilus sp.]
MKHPAKSDLEALSEFRYQLRRFLRFSEKAAHAEGLTPQQHQLLLHVKGYPGRDWASVSELAERLQMQPHSALALVARCEALGLVLREGAQDRRQVLVSLSPDGEARLMRLAALHQRELRSLKEVFQVANISALSEGMGHGPS